MTPKKKPRGKKPSLQQTIPKAAAEVIHSGKCYLCQGTDASCGLLFRREFGSRNPWIGQGCMRKLTERATREERLRLDAEREEFDRVRTRGKEAWASQRKSTIDVLRELQESIADLANTSGHMGDVAQVGKQETASSFLAGQVAGLGLAARCVTKKLDDLD